MSPIQMTPYRSEKSATVQPMKDLGPEKSGTTPAH